MTNSIEELRDTDVIFVIGSNTREAHPQIARRIIEAADKGARLIVADPRRTSIAGLADIHLQIRPGTDIALINAMMKVILSEGLIDMSFIEMRTEGFRELQKALYKQDFDELVDIAGVSSEDVMKAARLYAGAYKAVICYCLGITQHVCGTSNVESLANLAMLTGHVEQKFTGVNPLRGQNNVQGACDMGALPNVFPGYQSVKDEHIRKKFESAWKTELNPEAGLSLTEMTHHGIENGIRAMFIMGENPVLSDPDALKVERNLKSLDFLVVSDIFLTETARLADVVFPAASFAEKTGTVTNSERRVQLMERAIPPVGKARADYEIITGLSSAMGCNMEYGEPSEIMEEIALLTPIYGGIFYDRLKKTWGLQWPCPERTHNGTPYLHKYSFTRGKGLFIEALHTDPDESPDKDYPFILISGRVYHHYHTGAMTRSSHFLSREAPFAVLEMNSEDMKGLNIRNGAVVRVRSRRGEMEVRAFSSERVKQGAAYTSFHFKESPVNRLVNPCLDPVAKCPEYKVCAASIEAVSP